MCEDEKTTTTILPAALKTGRQKAKSLWPKAEWIDGRGDYASVADCPAWSDCLPVRNAREGKASQIYDRRLRLRRFMPRRARA
jgi:hypothetical protein